MTKVAALPIYGKNMKILLLCNRKADDLKVDMQHRVLEYYQACSKNDSGLTLTYFMARSNFVPYAFVWEKVKTMEFSETIVVYDITIGRFSQLNKYMKLVSTMGQAHSLTLVQISQIQYF